MCLPRRFETNDSDDDQLTVGKLDTERCTICGGGFKHYTKYVMANGMQEVVYRVAHRGCLRIMHRIKTKRQQVTDLEYKIYLMQCENNVNNQRIR
jgi:hypothetical protein